MTEDVPTTVRFPKKVFDVLTAYLEKTVRMTLASYLQLCGLHTYEVAHPKESVPNEAAERLQNAIYKLFISQGSEAQKMLLSFRRITGNGHLKKTENSIKAIIAILPGGVTETFDLTANWGEQYTISRNAAFDLLLSTDPTLYSLIKRVMQSQSTDSVTSALRRILEDECKYLDHEAQAEGYAQNTYGIVPKRTNKNELPREEL